MMMTMWKKKNWQKKERKMWKTEESVHHRQKHIANKPKLQKRDRDFANKRLDKQPRDGEREKKKHG